MSNSFSRCFGAGNLTLKALANCVASKVISHVRFGFAAGCEAPACRAVEVLSSLGGYALRAASDPVNPTGLSPEPRAKPGII
jgi:hypothetical protein